jgi:predicted dehydrogenase
VRGAPGSAPLPSGSVRWGVLATGLAARLFTADLVAHGHRVTAVGSRSAQGAQAFADEFGIPNPHGSYEGLVADPDVDVVYVATPHVFHAENAAAALEQGKHVLVEKAFTSSAAEACQVVDLARRHGLLVLEAMWTRFLPHMAFVRDVVASGRLGAVRSLHADHTQRLPSEPEHRLNNPALGGGALLDLGVYPLSFAHDVLGPPTEVTARATLKDTGVDGSVATVLRHEGGAISTSFSSSEAAGPNRAVVLGTEGRIEIDSVWYTPAPVTVLGVDGAVIERFAEPVSGRGMQYQAAEVERLLEAGETASPLMTPEDSIAVVETMDAIRAAIGVRYPSEW